MILSRFFFDVRTRQFSSEKSVTSYPQPRVRLNKCHYTTYTITVAFFSKQLLTSIKFTTFNTKDSLRD